MKIVPQAKVENTEAVQLLRDAVAEAEEGGVTGACVILFRADRSFALWWSPGRGVNEKVGALERAKHMLITEADTS